MRERLHKTLSRFGVASRRASEQIILHGRVTVNGETILELGTKVDPEEDDIRLDGKRLRAPRLMYLLMYKPKGCVTTLSDPQKRPTVTRYLPELEEALKPVGRLDYNTEGALLFTNDGNLIQRLTHPKHLFEKTYEAEVLGVLTERQLNRLRRGVILDGKRTAPAQVSVLPTRKQGGNARIEMIIHEGRNRQIKRMVEEVGSQVIALKRTKVGFLSLGKMKPGECRMLKKPEVERLLRETEI
ncbi:MAG: pseudouridine synthase [Fimbriimonadales bacterium]